MNTTDEKYYRWTQWIFEQLYKKGLAYIAEVPVNWCPALGTVLANEEVIDGKSERGNHPVVRKPMRQWMLKITEYAERLLADLETLDWSEGIKEMQRNWIGKSEGAEVTFTVAGDGRATLSERAAEQCNAAGYAYANTSSTFTNTATAAKTVDRQTAQSKNTYFRELRGKNSVPGQARGPPEAGAHPASNGHRAHRARNQSSKSCKSSQKKFRSFRVFRMLKIEVIAKRAFPLKAPAA